MSFYSPLELGSQTHPLASLRLATVLFWIAFSFGVGEAIAGAWSQSLTFDEPNHLEWSERLLADQDISRDIAPYYMSQAPITILNVLSGRLAERVSPLRGPIGGVIEYREWSFRRFPTVLLFALLIISVRVLGTALGGPMVGLLAGIATALDPNLIAHGSLITVDVPFALGTVLLLLAAFRFTEHPSAVRAAVLGISWGAAFCIKFSANLLIVPIVLLPLLRPRMLLPCVRHLPRYGAWLILALFWMIFVIGFGYRFRGLGATLSEMHVRSTPFTHAAALLPDLSLPFPREFLRGIDRCLAAERTNSWNASILGEFSTEGFWYYFPLLFLLKTPLPLLIAAVLGLALLIRSGDIVSNPQARWLSFSLLMFAAYFCLLFRTQTGYRYVLFCLPILYILAALGWVRIRNVRETSTAFRNWLIVVVVGSMLEISPSTGLPIGFTNLIVSTPRAAYRYLADSNIDWAQDYGEKRRAAAELGLMGLPWNPPHITPGWNLISINSLVGIFLNVNQYRWVREHLEPERILGQSLLLYYVSPSVFDAFLRSNRSLPAASTTVCPPDTEPLPDDGNVALTSAEVRRICVHSSGGVLRVGNATAGIRFGTLSGSGSCSPEFANAKESLFFRLDPGFHAFCLLAERESSAHLELSPNTVAE